jgi:dTDP-glucose 4,6-dehydratase
MSNLLVTGGAGFIGANFVHYWLKKYPRDRVVVLDALTYAGNPANLVGLNSLDSYRFVRGDIRDQELNEKLLKEEAIDTIVNFAAESHVDRSILGPDAFLETNVTGTHNLLKAAKTVWLDGDAGGLPHRFHHVSTDEVYGSLLPDEPPFAEDHPYRPNSPYSASKASSDHFVRAYHHTYGMSISISNCSNNYGPYQFPEKLIPLMLIKMLAGESLPVYGDGLNVRDWLYVDDHCLGIELILKKGQIDEVYNIGGNNEWTNIDIIKVVGQLLDDLFESRDDMAERFPDAKAVKGGKSIDLIQYVKDRPGHDRRYAIDPGKSEKELGYTPVESFETGIRKTIEWYLDNEEWWRQVLDGSYREWLAKQYE